MIIIIGGTGFIGKHLTIALNKEKINHLSLSRNPDFNFPSKFAPLTRVDRISSLMSDDHIDDIKQAKLIVYLASASTPASRMNSAELEIENTIKPAIQTITKITSVNSQAQIVFLSSGGTVYGNGHTNPISENSPLKPATPYAYSKQSIENYLQYLSNTGSASHTILRTSNPVGKWHSNPRQGFIGAAINRIINDEPLTIFGDGQAVRDYIDADEVADAIIAIYKNPTTAQNKIWNLGSGVGSSLNDIIEKLRVISDKPFETQYKQSRATDLAYNVLNCSLIKAELGWYAKQNLDSILLKSWQHALKESSKPMK